MKQRDIYLANLNPVVGSEQAGMRPVVVISGDTMNTHLPVRIICPISSKKKRYLTCVTVKKSKDNGLKYDSTIIPSQVRTISIERLKKKLGAIRSEELEQIFHRLNDVLRH